MSNYDLALLFPPHCESALNGPHLALPQLQAYLQKKEFTVTTGDLNIGFFRWQTRPDKLIGKLNKIITKADGLSEKNTISPSEFNLITRAADALQLTTKLEKLAPDSVLIDELFQNAIKLISDSVYDVPANLNDIIDAISEKKPSPFDDYFHSLDMQKVVGNSPIIGISVAFHLQLYPALILAQILSEYHGDSCHIILGGSQINLMTDDQIDTIVSLSFISAISLYEGEIPLEYIIKKGLSVDFSEVPNMVYKLGYEIHRTGWHTPVTMEDLPTPVFQKHELDLYRKPCIFPVYVSKGCYWGKCKFCDYTKLYTPGQAKSAGWSTFRPFDKLIDDMLTIQTSFGAKTFYLVSEAITPSYYRLLASDIVKRRIEIHMSSYCRVEKGYSYKFFKLLSQSGVRSLTFGVEATSDRVLTLIDKGNTVEQIEKTIRYAHSAGISVIFNLIPDYPTTTYEEAKQTISFVEENIDYISFVNPQFFDLSSNSLINSEQELHGIEVTKKEPIHTNHGVHSITFKRTEGMSLDEITEIRAFYYQLLGDVRIYRHVKNLVGLVKRDDFYWNQARFQFTESIQCLDLNFDPNSNGQYWPRLEGNWVVFSHPDFKRFVLAPSFMGEILKLAQHEGSILIKDMIVCLEEEWDIPNFESAVELLKSCINTMIQNGLVKDITHPRLVKDIK